MELRLHRLCNLEDIHKFVPNSKMYSLCWEHCTCTCTTLGLTRAHNHASRVSGVDEYTLGAGPPWGFE